MPCSHALVHLNQLLRERFRFHLNGSEIRSNKNNYAFPTQRYSSFFLLRDPAVLILGKTITWREIVVRWTRPERVLDTRLERPMLIWPLQRALRTAANFVGELDWRFRRSLIWSRRPLVLWILRRSILHGRLREKVNGRRRWRKRLRNRMVMVMVDVDTDFRSEERVRDVTREKWLDRLEEAIYRIGESPARVRYLAHTSRRLPERGRRSGLVRSGFFVGKNETPVAIAVVVPQFDQLGQGQLNKCQPE